MTISFDEFFRGYDDSKQIFNVLLDMVNEIGPTELAVTKSQVAFRRNRPFAWVWIPGKYLRRKAAPLVLSISFPYPDLSPRWKQIIEPAHGRFMHHLELNSINDIDDEVRAWLQSAWEVAG